MNTAKSISTTDAEPISAIHALPGDAVVIRRPHFQLRGDSLFFLISRRPFAVLNHAEQNLWNVLENEASVGALRASLGDSAEEGIRRLLSLQVAELVPPASTDSVELATASVGATGLTVSAIVPFTEAESLPTTPVATTARLTDVTSPAFRSK